MRSNDAVSKRDNWSGPQGQRKPAGAAWLKGRSGKPVLAYQPGEVVRVRRLDAILGTLDADGQLDGLPFMPEMRIHTGKTFVISARLDKTCVEVSSVRFGALNGEDVVILDDLRCDGSAHDGCQKFCNFLWKASWLEPWSKDDLAEPTSPPGVEPDPGDASNNMKLASLLRTCSGGRYICQSSRLAASTVRLSRLQRLVAMIVDWRVVCLGAARVAARRAELLLWRLTNRKVQRPAVPLGLGPGRQVRVKPAREIIRTLDHKGAHRGLAFPRAMRGMCERTFTVKSRVDKMIREDTGTMVSLKDTVLLEGAVCDGITCNGLCPRRQYYYWREDWLEDPALPSSAAAL